MTEQFLTKTATMIHVSLWISDVKTLTSISVSVNEGKKKYLHTFQLLKL
jgi:hypothetical protein